MPARQLVRSAGVAPRRCARPLEKIYFQDLLGQHTLESTDLFPEGGLARIRRRSFAVLHRLKLLAPCIQQPPTDAEFLRECYDVVALRQPVHGHLPKGLWKLSHAFLGHLPPLSCVKCANSPCLNLGGQSIFGAALQTKF